MSLVKRALITLDVLMKNIELLAPVKEIDDINLIEQTCCKGVYISCSYFLKNGFDFVYEFTEKAKQLKCKFYISFKKNIKENEIQLVFDFLNFLEKTNIDGILINNFSVLEAMKSRKMPFNIIIDSGLNIHNLSGVEFVNLFHPVENINLTEEVYLKNISKIKKYTKYNLSIDSDNLPWIAENIKKSKAIDMVIIKGKFKTSKELVEGIQLVQNILEHPKIYKNQKLPFKNNKNHFYGTNHFSGEFFSSESEDFKFRGNIKKIDLNLKKTRLKKSIEIDRDKIPRLNLRLTSLEQITYLKKYIKKLGFNPIFSIEYGEILNTADLSKNSFNIIIEKIKKFCYSNNIKLYLSTPRILIERDFDRAYEYVKQLFLNEPFPSSLVVNNIGFWWAAINDSDYERTSIELGQGLELDSSSSILCLSNQHKVSSVDLSNMKDIKEIETCIKNIKNNIPVKKLTIGGCIKVPSSGLCPLNNNSAILSRLSCTAPCHNGNHIISDPHSDLKFLMAVDGFCRMHLFKEQILDLFKYIREFEAMGVNEFIIDFSSLNAKFLPILLNKFLNALYLENYTIDDYFTDDEYKIKKYFEQK